MVTSGVIVHGVIIQSYIFYIIICIINNNTTISIVNIIIIVSTSSSICINSVYDSISITSIVTAVVFGLVDDYLLELVLYFVKILTHLLVLLLAAYFLDDLVICLATNPSGSCSKNTAV
jgi:hypothetical protein